MARFRNFRRKRFGRRRYSKRRFFRRGTRKAFVAGKRRAWRSARRKSGSFGKVGVYIPELGAKVYVARHKYRVMYQFAKLIAHKNLNQHHHKMDAVPLNALDSNNKILHARHLVKKVIPKAQYRKLVQSIIVQMIKKNWYSLWYLNQNDHLATKAEDILDKAHSHQSAHPFNPQHHIAGGMPLVAPLEKDIGMLGGVMKNILG